MGEIKGIGSGIVNLEHSVNLGLVSLIGSRCTPRLTKYVYLLIVGVFIFNLHSKP